MSTCNRLDLQALGFQLVMPKNLRSLLGHTEFDLRSVGDRQPEWGKGEFSVTSWDKLCSTRKRPKGLQP